MVKKPFVASVEYCCGYELKVIWHCSKNARRSLGLEQSNVSGARTWDWLVVGGLGGGAAMFWLIVSRACTNCWTGLIALVDSCAEIGGDCCRVGGVRELHNGGGGQGGHFPLAFEIQHHWFPIFPGVTIKKAFSVQPVCLRIT